MTFLSVFMFQGLRHGQCRLQRAGAHVLTAVGGGAHPQRTVSIRAGSTLNSLDYTCLTYAVNCAVGWGACIYSKLTRMRR